MLEALSVISWNTHFPTFAKDAGYVIEYLQKANADVICLQEYVGGKDGEVKAWLSENGYLQHYLPFAYDKSGSLSQGVMTAAKATFNPVFKSVVLRDSEPRFMRNFPNKRGLVCATVNISGKTVDVLNVHLTVPRPWTVDLRKQEFNSLMSYLKAKQNSALLLTGDFNFNIIDKRRNLLTTNYAEFSGNKNTKTWQWRGMNSPLRLNLDATYWDESKIQVFGELGNLIGYDHRPQQLSVTIIK